MFYKKFFNDLQSNFEIEKNLLFYQYLKSKQQTLQNTHSKSNPCIICFEDFSDYDICELNCSCLNKFYHEKCLKMWIEKKSSCPICRKFME
jgi:hypothetical protein